MIRADPSLGSVSQMPSMRPVALALLSLRLPAGSVVVTALAAHMVSTGWLPWRSLRASSSDSSSRSAGDMLAKATLVNRIYKPLSSNSSELLETLTTYLESGRSLETTARSLFVHPNTVRYRLKRISEIIGWDATGAREAFILQVAMVLGSMNNPEQPTQR